MGRQVANLLIWIARLSSEQMAWLALLLALVLAGWINYVLLVAIRALGKERRR